MVAFHLFIFPMYLPVSREKIGGCCFHFGAVEYFFFYTWVKKIWVVKRKGLEKTDISPASSSRRVPGSSCHGAAAPQRQELKNNVALPG